MDQTVICFYEPDCIDERVSAWLLKQALGADVVEFRLAPAYYPDPKLFVDLKDRYVIYLTRFGSYENLFTITTMQPASLLVFALSGITFPQLKLHPGCSWDAWNAGRKAGNRMAYGIIDCNNYDRVYTDALSEIVWRYLHETKTTACSANLRFPIVTYTENLDHRDVVFFRFTENYTHIDEILDCRSFDVLDTVLLNMLAMTKTDPETVPRAKHSLMQYSRIGDTDVYMTVKRTITIGGAKDLPGIILPTPLGTKILTQTYQIYGSCCIIEQGTPHRVKQTLHVLTKDPLTKRHPGTLSHNQRFEQLTESAAPCYYSRIITPIGWLSEY